MDKTKKYFPWLFFWKLTFSIFFVVAFFLTTFFIFGHSHFNFIAFVLVSFAVSMIMAYRFALPVKKIVLKTMRLANKRLFYEMNGQKNKEALKIENEEFFELEQYLEEIKSKLKLRSQQMAHGYEESKTLMSSIEEAVISVDQGEKILFFNAAFASKFVPRELLPETHLNQVFKDYEILKLFRTALKHGQPGRIQKNLTSNVDDIERIFSISVSPLRDKKTHEIFEVMGIFHDISEIRRAEQLRTEFVENASHELRTPLTSVQGYLDMIAQDIQAGNMQDIPENLSIVNKGIHRLRDLVDDLLTLSKLEHGARLQLEAVIPEMITEDVFQKMTPLAQKKNVRLSYKNHGVDFVSADAARLDQVLSNLIGNAIKYTRDDGSVHVSWHNHADTTLVVKDDGPGIAKVHQARLFERFYRVDRARSREIGGTGLGLAIVKHIMQVHGGSVSVRSDLGQGAEFICEFPKNREL